jgi:polyphosphate kinase
VRAVALGRETISPEVDGSLLEASEVRYVNRELSWLDFNRRVLALAASPTQPLLERAKFLAIFSTNLDEFFQVRVAGLKDQLAAGISGTAPDGLSVPDQLKAVRAEVKDAISQRSRIYNEVVVPELASHGTRLVPWSSLGPSDKAYTETVFESQMFPVLTPLGVDPGHPFPYISNLSLNLAVMVRDPQRGDRRFARVKIPPLLPGFLTMPDGERFVPVEQVVAAFLGELFPGMEIESYYAFRVIRNADLTLAEEEADDLLEAVEMELRRRRFGRAVCLQVESGFSTEVLDLLIRELDLNPEDVYEMDGLLDYSALWEIHSLDRPELKDEPFSPVTPSRLSAPDDGQVDIFAAIAHEDIFVHHPYESFAMSTEAFVKQAARDPKVLAIKQTLYRTSGDSPVVTALIRAAERGKQVAALVELKARGDEAANIGWARALEQAGVHVVYGLIGRDPPLLPHRYRQLQLVHGPSLRRYWDPDRLAGARRGPDRPVQFPNRLQPPVGLPAIDSGTSRSPFENNRAHRKRGRTRSSRTDRLEIEQPRRPQDNRRSLRCFPVGGSDRPDSAGGLWAAPRCPWAFRDNPHPVPCRALSRTLTDLLFRRRREH